MNGTSPRVLRYRFGPFELDPGEAALSRNGIRVRLQDLPYRLLLMLVERPGEIVTREEVRQHLWPENTFVEFDNSLGVAIRKVRESLNDNADEPRYVATVPRRGYRFLAPVIVETRPDPLLVSPLLEAPHLQPVTPESRPLPPAPPVSPELLISPEHSLSPAWKRRTLYWAALAVAVAAMLAAGIYRFYSQRSVRLASGSAQTAEPAVAPIRIRRSVAVLGFRNLPGRPEDDWLSPVFSEMLDTELGTRGDLRMVSAEDIARVKHDLPPTGQDTLSRSTLDRLRQNPGADVVVLGSYTPMPGKDNKRIRLDLRVQDTKDGETIAEEAITGDDNDLFDLAAQAGARLRQRLGLSANSMGDANEARVALPSDQRSARLYVEGRARLWAFDFLGARDLLIKAVAADSQFPLAHSALSEAWWHLGYQGKARVEAQKARDLSQDLPQEDRLLIEGQYWRAMTNWPMAVQTYRSLFQTFPDSLDYGLLLATAQAYVQPTAALQTLASLRKLPPPVSDDARIDMTEASALIGQDLVKARAAAKTAIAKGLAQGRPVLVARTYGFLCQQSAGIGADSEEELNNCKTAYQTAVSTGDRNAQAMMLNNLASLYVQQGDFAHAEAMFSTTIQLFREVGNADGIATSMSNLGAVHLARGDLSEARKLLEDCIPHYREIDDKEGVALALNNLGDLSRQNGKLAAAETNYRQGKALADEIESKSAAAYTLSGLGDVYMDRGNLVAAHESFATSLALRKQIGEQLNVGEAQIALARLAIEEGHVADVPATLRQWKHQFHSEQQTDDELAASIGLADALLAQGKRDDAEKEIEGSQDLAGKTQILLYRLQYELVSIRALLASNHPESAKQSLQQVLKAAHDHGLVEIELEAMLAAAELEYRTGNKAAAANQFAGLEHLANDKGYTLVAHKAAARAIALGTEKVLETSPGNNQHNLLRSAKIN